MSEISSNQSLNKILDQLGINKMISAIRGE